MKRFLAILLALAMLFLLVACGGNDATGKDTGGSAPDDAGADLPKVMVLLNPEGSGGFTDEAYVGLRKAQTDFEGKVIIEYTEVNQNVIDYEAQGRVVAESGEYDLIIVVGAAFSESVKLIADDYPDQQFTQIDSKIEEFDNVRSVGAKDPEQAFLSGVLCGLITTGEYKDTFPMTNDANALCYAGGGDIPTSRAGAAGFMAGALYVNPEVDVSYTIVGSWNDPTTAKEIALLGIANGADVCTGNCGSGIKGVLEACKEKSAYFIATSPSDNDLEYSLCCSVKKTDVLTYDAIKNIVDNDWEAGYFSYGIAEGVCDISFEGTAFDGKIPADIMAIIDEIRQQIIDGKLSMPADVSDLDGWSAANQYQR